MISRTQKINSKGAGDDFAKYATLYMANVLKAQSELMLGDFQAGEQSARAALAAKKLWMLDPSIDVRQEAFASTLIALALAEQNRLADAQLAIDPVVKLHRDFAAKNHGDQTQRVEMARALYAEGLAVPARRAVLLREAAALLDSIPNEMKTLSSVAIWRDRVREAMH